MGIPICIPIHRSSKSWTLLKYGSWKSNIWYEDPCVSFLNLNTTPKYNSKVGYLAQFPSYLALEFCCKNVIQEGCILHAPGYTVRSIWLSAIPWYVIVNIFFYLSKHQDNNDKKIMTWVVQLWEEMHITSKKFSTLNNVITWIVTFIWILGESYHKTIAKV